MILEMPSPNLSGLNIPCKQTHHIAAINLCVLFKEPCKSALVFYLARPVITILTFNSLFHSRLFFCGTSRENLALLSLGFISNLQMAHTYLGLSPCSSISGCVLLQDLFAGDHLTLQCVQWNLCAQRFFFLLLSVQIGRRREAGGRL